MRIYLIDGVRVSKKIFERRQLWGEHLDAKFMVVESSGWWTVVERVESGGRP